MRKLSYPNEPEVFKSEIANFKANCQPSATRSESERWREFKDTCQESYKAVQSTLYANQQGLCAYCEVSLGDNHHKQIEHFVPKSSTTIDQDYTCNFQNMLACCNGGTNPHSNDYSADHTPQDNHSCGQSKGDTNPQGRILNPYELPEIPVIKIVTCPDDQVNYEVDIEACSKMKVDANLIDSTLEHLRINCPRLARRRGQIWTGIYEELEEAREQKQGEPNRQMLEEDLKYIADFHLGSKNGKLEAFYTLRLLLLSEEIPHLLSIK